MFYSTGSGVEFLFLAKHASLSRLGVNDAQKSFITLVPGRTSALLLRHLHSGGKSYKTFFLRHYRFDKIS